MKTKLLKKVRRRFQIIKVLDYSVVDFKYLSTDIKKLSLPFYVVIDKRSILYHVEASQTMKKAQEELIGIVKRTYKDTKKSKLKAERVY